MTGRIVKLIQDRGFGFIRIDGTQHDMFMHANGIVSGPEWEDLHVGMPVQFDEGQSQDGRPKAIRIMVLEGE